MDASYVAHNDMLGHTRATMFVVHRLSLSTFKNQKLNTKRSTKANLIEADDALPQMLWTKYFTKEK